MQALFSILYDISICIQMKTILLTRRHLFADSHCLCDCVDAVVARSCRKKTALMDGRVDFLNRNSSLTFELEKAFGAFKSIALLDEPNLPSVNQQLQGRWTGSGAR